LRDGGRVPTWKSGGYVFRVYENDHPPMHCHVFKDGAELDRYNLEEGEFMDGTIGRHRGLRAMRAVGLIA
jgi:hypothetical protein